MTSPSLVLSFVKREEGGGIQCEDSELMHPRHVSRCLACRAASCPPQGAPLPQIFLLSSTIKAQGGGSTYSPCSPSEGPQGHLIYFYMSFPPSVPPFLSFLIPLPHFQK